MFNWRPLVHIASSKLSGVGDEPQSNSGKRLRGAFAKSHMRPGCEWRYFSSQKSCCLSAGQEDRGPQKKQARNRLHVLFFFLCCVSTGPEWLNTTLLLSVSHLQNCHAICCSEILEVAWERLKMVGDRHQLSSGAAWNSFGLLEVSML